MHGLAAQPRDQLRLLARRHRAVERVVHLQQRDDAFAPAGAHPQLGVPRRRALNQGVQRRVRLGAPQPTADTTDARDLDPALGFLARARAGALGPSDRRCFPAIPMPARAVIELDVAEPFGLGVWQSAESCDTNGSSRSYLVVDRARFGYRLADHLGELAHAGAEYLGEVDVLGRLALEPGHVGDQLRGSRRRDRCDSDRPPPSRCGRLCCDRVVHDESEFLLRDVGLGPDLALFRQEHAADQRRQLLVARRHLLQRRIGIGKAQRRVPLPSRERCGWISAWMRPLTTWSRM